MKKILFWVGALIVSMTIATGCSNEEVVEQVQSKKTVVTATIENGSARTSVNSLYNVVWSQGDSFTVFGDVKKGNMTLIGEGGSTTGEFEIISNSSSIEFTNGDVALFPAVSDNVDMKSYTFPSTYTTTETDAPMLGTYNGTSFSFKPLSAFIRVNASGLNDNTSHTLTITSETEALTGEATLGANNVLVPSGNGKTIMVTLTADADGSITFDAPIPAQTYTKLTITLDNANEPLKTKENFTAVAGVLYEATELVTTATDLKNALQKGGNIDLNASFSMTEDLDVTENTILDLNGQELDAADFNFTVAEGKSFTIQNAASLARSATSPTIKSSKDIITASSNSTINIGEGVNLINTAENCCIFIPKDANGVTVNTAGNLLTEGKDGVINFATIYVNGKVTSGTINIIGGSVKHNKDCAVYVAGKADVNISGDVEIEGTTGVEIRGGSLTIEGGTITGNGNPATATPNGNGSTTVGSAVAVSQHTTNHAITATIKGGTFNGINALYEADLQATDQKATEVTMSVTGGTFIGAVSSKSCTNFISGGIFSDASAFDYLADNANVTVGKDMNITKAITIPTGISATINLNGKTIENKTAGHPSMITPNVDDECVVFMVNGTLTIEGEGNVKATGDGEKSDYNTAVWAMGENAKAIINGGNYTNSKDTEDDGCDLIYARDGANIVINGGSFQSYIRSTLGGGIYDVLDCKDKTNSKITVNGGKFQNYVPSYENVTPTGYENEVVLGEGKAVYNNEILQTTAHSKEAGEMWYEVKDSQGNEDYVPTV